MQTRHHHLMQPTRRPARSLACLVACFTLALVLLAAAFSPAPASTTLAGAVTWAQLPAPGGDVADISVGSNGDTWILAGGYGQGAGYLLHKWNPQTNGWDTYGDGRGVKLDVAPDGTPYLITEAGFIHHRHSDGTWEELPTSDAYDIAVGPSGKVWALVDHGRLAYWDRTNRTWHFDENVTGKRLDVHPDGTPYVIAMDGQLWRGSTSQPAHSLYDLSFGGSSLWTTGGAPNSHGDYPVSIHGVQTGAGKG